MLKMGEHRTDQSTSSSPPSSLRTPHGSAELSHKLVAASVGAITVSLLTTPFDLVKTRLQTKHQGLQSPPPHTSYPPSPSLYSSSIPSTSSSHMHASSSNFPHNCCHVPSNSCKFKARYYTPSCSYHSTGSGSGSAFASAVSLLSPSSLPTASSASNFSAAAASSRPSTGSFNAIVDILKSEGLPAMWKGLTPTLVMAIPNAAIYMIGYEYFKTSSVIALISPTETLIPLFAGSTARIFSTAAVSPIELFKTRLQASNAPSFSLVLAGVTSMVRQQGAQSLWRGLGPTLWKDVPFSGVYWAGYETLKTKLLAMRRSGSRRDVGNTLGISFASGAISGSCAAFLTHPFDVLKTRKQTSISFGNKTFSHPSVFQSLRRIATQEGLAVLWSGFTPRVAKVAPSCGIMISCYEGVGKLLGKTG